MLALVLEFVAMGINAEVQKSGNETSLATIRKFSRRVQGAGLVKLVPPLFCARCFENREEEARSETY